MPDLMGLDETALLLIQRDAAGPGLDAVALKAKPDWRRVDAANAARGLTADVGTDATIREIPPEMMEADDGR